MPELSKDVVALLSFLLPGFLVAWVFYALTSHQKPVQSERIIQALIFTLFVKAAVAGEKLFFEFVGRWWTIGEWGSDSDLIASLMSALIIGYVAGHIINNDSFHKFLRDKGVSTRSSHPSEWYTVFSKYQLFVILNFKDGRRLFGWPEVWPSDPEKGHFFIVIASWLDGDSVIDLSEANEGILVDVKDINFVEFVQKPQDEV